MVLNGEAALAGYQVLPALDFRVVEFLDATAIDLPVVGGIEAWTRSRGK